MRSFLAGVALLLAGVIGTAALTAFVAHETVLARRNADRLMVSALERPALRHDILQELLPTYDRLPPPVRREVNRITRSRDLDRALRHVRIDADGAVHLRPLRHDLQQVLRDRGMERQAAVLGQLPADGTVRLVPATVLEDYRAARQLTWEVATLGGLTAGLLLVAALVVAPNRRAALLTAGLVVLVGCAAGAALWWWAPALARFTGHGGWAPTLAALRDATTSQALLSLAPFAAVGLAAALASLLLPRR
jgi:hypothetical protein